MLHLILMLLLVVGIPGSSDANSTPQKTGPGNVCELSEVDQKPMPTFRARPQYPAGLRLQGVNGEVVVELVIDEQGRVGDTQAVYSTRREFVAPALAAVRKWRFRPGRKDGQVVKVRLTVPIVFTLEKK